MTLEVYGYQKFRHQDFFDGFVPHTPETVDHLERERVNDNVAFLKKLQNCNASGNTTNPTLAKLYEILDT